MLCAWGSYAEVSPASTCWPFLSGPFPGGTAPFPEGHRPNGPSRPGHYPSSPATLPPSLPIQAEQPSSKPSIPNGMSLD
ncbi:hypothetical protein ASPCADRAFT_211542 [Aspergillus carbonarius ITEM 5010]|uniref:Uncharacterized protein n=1 Tax=Aspergillus carbonarius (strain ITEM 5010) TaxID=602072 RepID=A0A1R3R911_ASPC5|nr:hypothetical protein ASPCADRAFT_211542 [Aspergillus carbonarius ITEM 5010]